MIPGGYYIAGIGRATRPYDRTGIAMSPPIVIIGAGRSGTNLLRDLLCAHPDVVTWPCLR